LFYVGMWARENPGRGAGKTDRILQVISNGNPSSCTISCFELETVTVPY
jgi:hypothetical protein